MQHFRDFRILILSVESTVISCIGLLCRLDVSAEHATTVQILLGSKEDLICLSWNAKIFKDYQYFRSQILLNTMNLGIYTRTNTYPIVL